MSTSPEQQDQVQLQHDAEHERPPRRRNPVLFYLVILFAAAFLLLLMSYFAQQRANQAAMDDLTQSSNSAVQTLDQILQERDSLRQQTEDLKDQLAELQTQLADADRALQEAEDNLAGAEARALALHQLNQIRALYNQRQNTAARALLAEYGNLEQRLEEISAAMTDEEREIYDPLEAYHTISDSLATFS